MARFRSEPDPSLPLDQVLAGAPCATENGFEVPTFVDPNAPERAEPDPPEPDGAPAAEPAATDGAGSSTSRAT